ncbi:MAG: hypothetical protein H6510_04100 [Acidobacteria bacterium]|nr:hypothetical protein [Acidobacteriota bacterium]MCB9396978.1 hypothetical protein [Acidobacteriota bacterium]
MRILKGLILAILLFLILSSAFFSPAQKVDVWTPWGLLQAWPLGGALFLFACFGFIAATLFSLLDRGALLKELKQLRQANAKPMSASTNLDKNA